MSISDPLDPSLNFMVPGAAHPNPMFDYLTAFVPRKLKDLFKWGEYLAYNSAHIYGVVKKFGEYPITRFVYGKASESERQQHIELFEESLNLKGFLTEITFDKYIYGNSFISVYTPIKRDLICNTCKNIEDIKVADYVYNMEQVSFRAKCRNCKDGGIKEIRDTKLKNKDNIQLIRWDPKLIDVNVNPVTGECEYYYTLPREFVQQVKSGDKLAINGTPLEFLRAMREKKTTFKFNQGQIYHLKIPGLAGTQSQWGFPPLTSAIKLFLFAAILRKANEAIALEHITPFRVFHPVADSPNADPASMINMQEWRQEMTNSYKLFRKDPLHIQFSPIAIGVQNVGGEGRAMLTLGELQEAEKNIVLSMGVVPEFISGGLGQVRGEITLRQLENQLQVHIEDLNRCIKWVEKKGCDIMGYKTLHMKLADFKMIDDTENKQLILQLAQQGEVSPTRIHEMLNIDTDKELKQKNEYELKKMKYQMELEAEQQKMQNSIAQKAQRDAQRQQSGGLQYDQQALIAQADQIVQEMLSLDVGTRRSRMDALQGEDAVMYALVRYRIEQQQQNDTQTAKQQAQA